MMSGGGVILYIRDLGGCRVIKYAHNTYDGRTRKIPLEDTIGLLPEEKADICQRDRKCWSVLGACT